MSMFEKLTKHTQKLRPRYATENFLENPRTIILKFCQINDLIILYIKFKLYFNIFPNTKYWIIRV